MNHTQLKIKVNSHLLEAKQKYNEFIQTSQFRKLKFFWVPAYVGIEENDKVDKTAKLATEDSNPMITKIPYTDIKPIFKGATTKTITQMKEQGSVTGIDYFKYYFTNISKAWFQKFNFMI